MENGTIEKKNEKNYKKIIKKVIDKFWQTIELESQITDFGLKENPKEKRGENNRNRI